MTLTGKEVIVKRERPLKNHVIRVIVICSLLSVMAVVPFNTLWPSQSTICIHYHLLGFQCPLCGMTRAVHQFLHFRFASALHYNVVVFLLPFYLVLDVVTLFFQSSWLKTSKRIAVIAITLAFFILYLYRIISFFH